MKRLLSVALMFTVLIGSIFSMPCASIDESTAEDAKEEKEKIIRWVDFDVCAAALREGAALDIDSHASEAPLSWVDLLAYYAMRHGGSFSSYKTGDLQKIADTAHSEGKSVYQLGESSAQAKLFRYYRAAYGAVLDGMLGTYQRVLTEADSEQFCETEYGVCAFFPIAQGYSVGEYDDFGAARSYGYRRRHLGHDMLGSVGTPICAVESGYVEALGWNQYGGWRIGIRSFDGKRYYYYAHLRKGAPYEDLYEGKVVHAGEVIGYLGTTGYSPKEDTNNIDTPHLHIGLELIFSPEQKDGYCQIWINFNELSHFLADYRSKTVCVAKGRHRATSYLRSENCPQD